MTTKITRRALARHVGVAAGGVSLLGSSLVHALVATPHQTAGPFYPPLPHGETDVDLTLLEGHAQRAKGNVILVRGQVRDHEGNPVRDAQVHIWQANDHGRYDHPDDPNPAPLDPDFQGIGITTTDADGRFGFKTIKPAAYPLDALGDSGMRAQHIHFKIMQDETERLVTQMYFAGDPLLAQDGPYNSVPEEERALLVTQPVADGDSGLPMHEFNLTLPVA